MSHKQGVSTPRLLPIMASTSLRKWIVKFTIIFRDLTRAGIALPYVDDVIIPEDKVVRNLEKLMQLCKDCPGIKFREMPIFENNTVPGSYY